MFTVVGGIGAAKLRSGCTSLEGSHGLNAVVVVVVSAVHSSRVSWNVVEGAIDVSECGSHSLGDLDWNPMRALTLSLRSAAPALSRPPREGGSVVALGRGCSLPRSNCV